MNWPFWRRGRKSNGGGGDGLGAGTEGNWVDARHHEENHSVDPNTSVMIDGTSGSADTSSSGGWWSDLIGSFGGEGSDAGGDSGGGDVGGDGGGGD